VLLCRARRRWRRPWRRWPTATSWPRCSSSAQPQAAGRHDCMRRGARGHTTFFQLSCTLLAYSRAVRYSLALCGRLPGRRAKRLSLSEGVEASVCQSGEARSEAARARADRRLNAARKDPLYVRSSLLRRTSQARVLVFATTRRKAEGRERGRRKTHRRVARARCAQWARCARLLRRWAAWKGRNRRRQRSLNPKASACAARARQRAKQQPKRPRSGACNGSWPQSYRSELHVSRRRH
jgi:hypothetical protein